jgi:hypothetical protein
VQVVVQAVSVIAPLDPLALQALLSTTDDHDLREMSGIEEVDFCGLISRLGKDVLSACAPSASPTPTTPTTGSTADGSTEGSTTPAPTPVAMSHALTSLLVRDILSRILLAPTHVRVADELFLLIRDLAAIPSVCTALLQSGAISRLAFFAVPDQSPPEVKTLFLSHSLNTRLPVRNDFNILLQSVFEAMAALLGVPQVRKVNLLQEHPYWESVLVPAAKEAFTNIFNEMSINGGMDSSCMGGYMEKVNGQGTKVTALQVCR